MSQLGERSQGQICDLESGYTTVVYKEGLDSSIRPEYLGLSLKFFRSAAKMKVAPDWKKSGGGEDEFITQKSPQKMSSASCGAFQG